MKIKIHSKIILDLTSHLIFVTVGSVESKKGHSTYSYTHKVIHIHSFSFGGSG